MVSRYLNRIEQQLIRDYSQPYDSVLNLEAGFDLLNGVWTKIKDRKVVSMTRDDKCWSRVKSNLNHPCILSSNLETDLMTKIKPYKPTLGFDLITILWSIERVFDDQDRIDSLLNRISALTAPGGHIIITGFSGERINHVLSHKPVITQYYKNDVVWRLKKKYNSWSLVKPNIKCQVEFYYGKGQSKLKSLPDFDYIIQNGSKYGFEMLYWAPVEVFERNNEISRFGVTKADLKLAYLNDILVLKRLN